MAETVIFIDCSSRMGGVQFSTAYLAKHLDPQQWVPLVVLPEKGEFWDFCQKNDIPVARVNLPDFLSTSFRLNSNTRLPNPLAWLVNLFLGFLGACRLAKFLKNQPAAVVVTKGLTSHLMGGLAAKIRRLPCLWHVQDFISERYFGLYRGVFNLLAGLLSRWIVVDGSPIAAQLWPALRKRTDVVLNGVDVDAFSPAIAGQDLRRALGIPPDGVVIGNVARITPWKGQHHLLETFASLCVKHPELYLVFVGAPVFDNDAYEQKLKRIRRNINCPERVFFLGFRHDLPQVLNGFDIFAYTAVEKDTSPLAVLSALACGLPVAAFDIPGIREVVGGVARLVPVGDQKQLGEAIIRLATDPVERSKRAGAARQRAVDAFSLACFVQAMQTVIKKTKDS